MLIIPAVDIKDGCVVRFVQGRRDKKIYSRDPLKTAKHWVKQGAQLIHVVDLDGAFSGTLKNLSLVKEIAKNVDVPIEFGGGVRKIETIKKLLNLGIQRVVLGTRAIENRVFLKNAFKQFKNKVIVSIDTRASQMLIKGWQSKSKNTDILKFIQTLEEIGFQDIIYTDTQKDGTLKGPNLSGIKRLLKNTHLGMIASGGIASLDDIYRLKRLEKEGLLGVIVGKALYEGRFTLAQALRLA